MNKKQQTAVQWLETEMKNRYVIASVQWDETEMKNRYVILLNDECSKLFKQALAMERKQMESFGNACVVIHNNEWDTDLDDFTTIAEHLFTDTYQTEP